MKKKTFKERVDARYDAVMNREECANCVYENNSMWCQKLAMRWAVYNAAQETVLLQKVVKQPEPCCFREVHHES